MPENTTPLQTKFTPGPWRSVGRCIHAPVLALGNPTSAIAFALDCGAKSGRAPEVKANADLIAAAPEMYTALEAVINSDMAMREEDEGRISDTLSVVRAALVKAREGNEASS